jgi:hypothetical protein
VIKAEGIEGSNTIILTATKASVGTKEEIIKLPLNLDRTSFIFPANNQSPCYLLDLFAAVRTTHNNFFILSLRLGATEFSSTMRTTLAARLVRWANGCAWDLNRFKEEHLFFFLFQELFLNAKNNDYLKYNRKH